MQSWEYYQQASVVPLNTDYDLSWICGLGAATKVEGLLLPFASLTIAGDDLYAVPFNQLREMRVSQMSFYLRGLAPVNGGRIGMAIYQNWSINNSTPWLQIVNAGSVPVSGAGVQPGFKSLILGRQIRLASQTRYWAVLYANAQAAGAIIDGIGNATAPVIFWGATEFRPSARRLPVTGLHDTRFVGQPLGLPSPLTPLIPVTFEHVPAIGLQFGTLGAQGLAMMEQGKINEYVPPNTFSVAGVLTGTLAASAVYSSGTFYGATAYQDLGTAGNTSTVTFTYQGAEAAGGVAVGVRLKNSAGQGVFAFIDSSGPSVKIYEMSSGWVYVQTASTSLTLTTGNSYTLTLADNGTAVTASITDDTSVKTCNISTTLNASNTEVMFGWIGGTASYAFNAYITGFWPSQTGTVATSDFFPVAGSYYSTQTVYLNSTPGASIFYTTDGSTPTSSSTPYTGPISVSASGTIKAMPSSRAGPIRPWRARPTRSYRGRWSSGPSTATRRAPSTPPAATRVLFRPALSSPAPGMRPRRIGISAPATIPCR